ncbi:AMP-binding protein [Nocardioides hwasunensis]|uniref:AMP-binding protein n=1 Tax=Nocardioides hwasunensis TaxID=397258 RepID=A0ABR8MI63_9ACTN|nr:AMP-binding protein [Nocardioides hwasunensis]MBD3915618.1 AMP-binding protein [Nocardioides hwasunensis]
MTGVATEDLGFWRLAAADPDAPAVVAADGSRTTRGELLAQANSLARLLRGLGLERGDRVVGVVSNEPATLALVLACQQAGAYYVPVNTSLTREETAYIVTDSAPVAVITSVPHAEMVAGALDTIDHPPERRLALGDAPGFRDALALAADLDDGPIEDRSPGSYLGYTSGTTGRPKGVLRRLAEGDPDDVFAAGARWQLGMFDIEPLDDGVHLVTSPLSHTAVSGLAVTSLHYGHAVVLMDRFDAEGVLRTVQDERVTTTHMVPTQLHRLLRLPEEVRGAYDVSSMRNLVHGAGPCPEAVKRAVIDWFGPVVLEYYGATEAAGTRITSREWLERPGSVGRPQPGAEVRILDADGEQVPPGTSGTVYLRMGAHAFEYRGDAAKTDAGRRGDFVTVGDLGRLDEDGYLFLLGRTSEVIVTGGVNVYPAEVEAAILEHPEVQDVGVIGVADPEWGDCVTAVVQVADDSRLARDPVAAGTELDDFLRTRLARFKVPRSWCFVPVLPRGANGKLRKHLLPDLLPK